MAIELEETIMREIGLGNHYSWFNGSGSCGYIRRSAIERLPEVAEKHGLTIAPVWLAHLKRAERADNINGYDGGRYRLTNVWIACSYAIQDATYRAAGDNGFEPEENFYFFSADERQQWAMQNMAHSERRFPFVVIRDDEFPPADAA